MLERVWRKGNSLALLECKLLQPPWTTAWRFLKLKTELPQDPAIPLLGIYLTKIKNSNLMEKAMAPHSSTLAWKIPWMEEPGRLQSMGSLGVGHD